MAQEESHSQMRRTRRPPAGAWVHRRCSPSAHPGSPRQLLSAAMVLAVLLLSTTSPSSARMLRDRSPGIAHTHTLPPLWPKTLPFFERLLKALIPSVLPSKAINATASATNATGLASHATSSTKPQVDAPGEESRDASYDDAGILASSNDPLCDDVECTGDLVCKIRRIHGVRTGVCRCNKGFYRTSDDSDTCIPEAPGSEDGGVQQRTQPSDTPKTRDTACDNKVCPEGQHCRPRRNWKTNDGSYYGSCTCPKGFDKPSPESPECISKSTGESMSPPKKTTDEGAPDGNGTEGGPEKPQEDTPEDQTPPAPAGSTPDDQTPPEPSDDAPEDQTPPAPADNGEDNGNVEEPCDESLFTKEGCKWAQDTVDRVNELRGEHGLGTLCLNNKLMAAAKKHSEYLDDRNILDKKQFHLEDDPSRSNSQKRMKQEGFHAGPMSENAGWNLGPPRGAVFWWERSTGHRKNMLMQGIGFAGVWTEGKHWIMDMGGKSGKERCNPYVR